MKKTYVPFIAGMLVAAGACAQSSVTIYGIVDQSVRYTTNDNASNQSNIGLSNGAVTNSRIGFKGEEAIDASTKAIFRLENGFDPQTGTANQNGSLFGRYAYVGLQSSLGTVKLGRQTTEAFNLSGEFDPLTVGNYTANSWAYYITGGRLSNAVSYEGSFKGLTLGATYGFGEVAGSLSKSSTAGLRATYALGNLNLGTTWQNTRAADNTEQKMWGASGIYSLGATKLFAGYLGGTDGSGVLDSELNDSSRTVSYGSYTANPRKDSTWYTGITYQASTALALTAALYYDSIKNVNGIAGNNGKRSAAVLLAEYSLSRRTQVYGTVDFNKVQGGAATELPGKDNQTGLAAGIRHMF